LAAVFKQAYTDFAVTVVDNGSNDRSAILVEERWATPKLTLIRNEENLGYAKAHNQAIRATDSKFVLTLNPDVILTATYVQEVVRTLSDNHQLGSAAGKLILISEAQFGGCALPGTDPVGFQIDGAGLIMSRNRRQMLIGHLKEASTNCLEQTPIFGPDGAAAFYRRSMLDDVALKDEYFDELFVTHKEDVDLAWRAQLLGWESVYVPQAIAYHVRGFRPGIRRPISAEIRRQAVRNRWLMYVKNETTPLFMLHLPHIVLYELGILAYMLLFEPSSLPAVADFIRLLPKTLERRRWIQERRQRGTSYMRQWFK
jgi:GT2 family glycosyltransferase